MEVTYKKTVELLRIKASQEGRKPQARIYRNISKVSSIAVSFSSGSERPPGLRMV